MDARTPRSWPVSPAPRTTYRPLDGRAAWFLTAMGLFVISTMLTIWLAVRELAIVDAWSDGEAVAGDVAEADLQLGFGGVLQVATLIATAILFLAWLVRANSNLAAIGQAGEHTTRGVVGWWFVPLANLVMPYRVVADITAKSAAGRGRADGPLRLWWGTFLIAGFVAPGFGAAFAGSDSVVSFRGDLMLSIASDALLIVSGVVLSVIVRSATGDQAENASAASGAPVTRDPSRSRAAWMLGSVAALGVVLAASLAILGMAGDDSAGGDDRSDAFLGLAVGSCVHELGFLDLEYTHVDCDEPHWGQAYALVRHPDEGSAYPGDDPVAEWAEQQCLRRFEAFAGEAYEDSPLFVYYHHPSRFSWVLGDREVICLVTDLDGGQLVGPARGERPRSAPTEAPTTI